MSGNVRVEIDGVPALIRRLRNVEDGIGKLKDTNRRAAQTVLDYARITAPFRSGALAGSGRTGATQRAGIIRFGWNASIVYGGPIHWGWDRHPWPPRRIRGGPITANPWASKAAQHTQPVWYDTYLHEVERLWDL